MRAKPTIDPAGIIEAIFYRMFHALFNHEGARRHLGFAQISFFMDLDGMPGWYLWFDGQNGAYQIVLSENAFDPQPAAPISLPVEGRFIVRYFPVEHEDTFNSLSVFEQALRISDMFDHTGTPTMIARQTMDPSFYTIGYINVRTRPERDLLEMECCAPDRWTDIRADGLYVTTENEERCEVVEPGGIDRDFPGWDLCFFLFDRLVSAFCAIHKQTPLFAAIAKAKGYLFVHDAKNGATIQRSDHVEELHLLVTIPVDLDRTSARVENQNFTAYGRHIQECMQQFNPFYLQFLHDPDADKNPWINPHWWHIGRFKFAEHAPVNCCCCCDH